MLWMKQQGIQHAEMVERVCALYLYPESQVNSFGALLSNAVDKNVN
jgi:hypothetical protein